MNKVDNKQKELLEKIKEFRLLDDKFMSKVFEDNYDCIELLLHIIMEKPDLKVEEARTQYDIKNSDGAFRQIGYIRSRYGRQKIQYRSTACR